MHFRAIALSAMLLSPACASAEAGFHVLECRKIWDGAPHSAFTDLIRQGPRWFCVLREGSAHIPGTNGRIRVLASEDGASWSSAALLAEPGVDLRDPKISATPDGRLMIVMGGSYYPGDESVPNRTRTGAWSRVSFSADGIAWSAPQPVTGLPPNSWLWRVTWHKGAGYGAVYTTGAKGGRRSMSVWKTADGVRYEHICAPDPGINLSEFTIRFLADDRMVILLRGEEKNRHAWIGVARPPYAAWTWTEAGSAAQGPNFIVGGDGRMVYAGRDYATNAPHTAAGFMTLEGLQPVLRLPSGGDCSYPGLVFADERTLWMSYYSSHEGRAAIYLAKIALP